MHPELLRIIAEYQAGGMTAEEAILRAFVAGTRYVPPASDGPGFITTEGKR